MDKAVYPGYGFLDDPHKADALFRLAGLTKGQYQDLHLAVVGGLKKINGARAKAMRALIGPDLAATAGGHALDRHVQLLADAGWYVGPRDCIQLAGGYLKQVKILRQWRDGRLRAAHVKALVAIYNDGILSEHFLAHVYGSQIVNELRAFGMIDVSTVVKLAGWRIYHLTSLGNYLVQDIDLLQSGGML